LTGNVIQPKEQKVEMIRGLKPLLIVTAVAIF